MENKNNQNPKSDSVEDKPDSNTKNSNLFLTSIPKFEIPVPVSRNFQKNYLRSHEDIPQPPKISIQEYSLNNDQSDLKINLVLNINFNLKNQKVS